MGLIAGRNLKYQQSSAQCRVSNRGLPKFSRHAFKSGPHGPKCGAHAFLHASTLSARCRSRSSVGRKICIRAAAVPREVTEVVNEVVKDSSFYANFIAGKLLSYAPSPVSTVLRQLFADVQGIVALKPTANGLARVLLIYYGFFTQPSPAFGIIDFYILNPLDTLLRKGYKVADLSLRDRLGGGNYGQVFEGVKNKNGERITGRQLTKEQKKRRVVLKRVNKDNTVSRSDFLRAGTMASGAAETGLAEGYMCSRIMRDPLAKRSAAEYLGNFIADASEGGFTSGTQWLVWKFESDATLAYASSGQIGEFPDCLEAIMLGREKENVDRLKRRAAIVRVIMRKLFTGLKRIHSLGLVHRDIKPENILVTTGGQVKIIDFGAAVDMCTGINFNPLVGMLDPRYSPPEELVMPKTFPRAPLPFLASLVSPLAWFYGRPDLFDSYSAGIVLLQLSVPELRSMQAARVFNVDLARVDYDLQAWRDQLRQRYDFSLLDRRKQAGWDLACKLVCKRNNFNRGRLSVSQALQHRFFLPEL